MLEYDVGRLWQMRAVIAGVDMRDARTRSGELNCLARRLQLRIVIFKMPTERRRRAICAGYSAVVRILLDMPRSCGPQCRATNWRRFAYIIETLIEIRFGKEHGRGVYSKLICNTCMRQVPSVRAICVGQIC